MTAELQRSDFVVRRDDLTRAEVHTGEVPSAGDGEALIRVDRFALTANNVTYGVAGDSIGYWQFFPASDGWGRIPVWGFGDVIDSHVEGLPAGERLYGYFPMSTHLVITPTRINAGRCVDGAAHRAELPSAYNQYTRVAADPGYDAALEDEQMLYRPLFMTSFFLDDWLEDNDFFGTRTVVLSSASSKTSLGLAWMLARRGDCKVIGLTSPSNVAFVESVGCYDVVVPYTQIADMPIEDIAFVDMAGSGPVRAALHGHFADAMKCSCAVGATHWEDARVGGTQERLPGPRPSMFFAPAHIEKRAREWGAGGIDQRVAEAWKGFVPAAQGWIHVRHGFGPQAVAAAYAEMVAGGTPPDTGVVLSMWPG